MKKINLYQSRSNVEKEIIKKYKNSKNKEVIAKLCNNSFSPKTMESSLKMIDRLESKNNA